MKQTKLPKPTLAMLNKCRSVKAVKELLLRYDCRGKPTSDESCPIARFIRMSGYPKASVGTTIWDERIGGYRHTLTPTQQIFIEKFDCDEIPELIMKRRKPA